AVIHCLTDFFFRDFFECFKYIAHNAPVLERAVKRTPGSGTKLFGFQFLPRYQGTPASVGPLFAKAAKAAYNSIICHRWYKRKMSSDNLASNFFQDIFPPRCIRVLGAGRFGRLAAERLKRRFPEALLSITDRDAARVDEITRNLGIPGEVEECIQSISRIEPPDDLWLIP